MHRQCTISDMFQKSPLTNYAESVVPIKRRCEENSESQDIFPK